MATTKDGIRVLHVDDEPDLTQLVADFLEREDERITVDTAPDAGEGLDRVTAEQFDCIVSDYDMPGQNGIEFLEALREEYPNLPFILYTGKGSEEVASDAISAGATDYLQKGTGTDQYELLANRIRNTVEQSRAQQRAAELERIRALVKDINQTLLRANSRSDVETQVCEFISDSDPYLFGWIGEVDAETGHVEPRTWAGIEDGYLDTITVTADETKTGRGPTGTAIRERQIVVSQNLQEDPEYEPWRKSARDRGYQSSAAVPLEYKDTLYGVLNIYAGRPDAFDDDEQEVLTELAGDIGHAIHAQEIKEDLERAQQRAEQYFETAGNIMVVLNADGTVARINERGCDLLGCERSELVGSDWFDLVVPGTIEGEITDIFSAFWSEDAQPIQTNVNPIETKDGEQIVVKWHNTAIRDQEGNVTGVLSSGIDITDRKQKELKLEQFKNAVEHAGHAVYITDTDGTIEYVNPAFETITGYSAEEALGRNPRILKSGEMSEGHYEELWETLLDGSVWEEEVINRRQDGELYTAHQTIAPILDENDDINAFVAVQHDITRRKEREEEIQELKNRLELAVEGTGLGVWDWDMRTDHVEFTEEWATMLGHSLDEIEPHLQAWEKRVHPDDIDGVEAALNDHIEGKTALYDTEHRMKTADGGWKWIRDIGHVVERDAEGEPLRAVGIHQDIDEKKEREQKLEDQRNKLDILNQILRHDIRNDLQLVTAYADLLEDDLDENLEHVETIQENAKHAIELTTTAQDMAEVWLSESDDQSQISLRSTLEKVLDEARAVHTDSEIQVDGEIPDVHVLADDMLPSMFDNLLKNAIQHNDKNIPAVNVCVEEGAEAVQVRVADNGPGVPDTRKESIFGEGERGMDSRGSGLGLYLVKTLIDKYGGSVWVEDNDPEGAVFVVELQKSAKEGL